MVRAMESDGLVTRTRDTEDKRKVRIHLSAQGRAIEPQLMQVAQTVNDQMVQDLTQAEAVLLKLLLKKVRASLLADSAAQGINPINP
jgi:DNA-binding MarR family transcriptional regulator